MLANLNDVLRPARRGGYAVGLFNTVNFEMARGVPAGQLPRAADIGHISQRFAAQPGYEIAGAAEACPKKPDSSRASAIRSFSDASEPPSLI